MRRRLIPALLLISLEKKYLMASFIIPCTSVTEDVTPPVLTFTRNGALTINDATITWSVNEPASANCTLTTPFTTSVFSCDSGSWSGSSLQGGIYELSIRLLDLGNNSAGPYVHKWRNGECYLYSSK